MGPLVSENNALNKVFDFLGVNTCSLQSTSHFFGTTLTLDCRDDPSFINSMSSVTGVGSCLGFDALNMLTVRVSDALFGN